MRVLLIYRNSEIGYSIAKVFAPIESELRKYADVESVELPSADYSFKGLWSNIRYAREQVKKGGYDIVHITGTEHYLIPFINHRNTIVTIHDLGSINNGIINRIRKKIKNMLFVSSLKYASYVTYISEKTKQEVEQRVEINNGVVIHNPIESVWAYHPKIYNKSYPVVLHIGTRSNKNLIRVIEALNNIRCHLRIIGKLKREQEDALNMHKIDYSVSFNLTDEEIIEEYINCDVVSFPSIYEGFGMPILEGQAIGRPVVTSNLSPMDKVAGGACVLVNPMSIESIHNGFIEAINNPLDYIDKGLVNVAKYNVADITRQYLEVYNDVIK